MNISKKEYALLVKKRAPKSKIGPDMFRAFLVGGIICCVGQAIGNALELAGADKGNIPALTSVILVFLGAFLTGIGVYDRIARFAGAGTLVPITGFANSVVSPALEFKAEGFIQGTATKLFAIAGPVLLFGVSASVIYGIVLLLI